MRLNTLLPVTVFLLIATAALLLHPRAVQAAPLAGAEYEGAMSDRGTVRLLVREDGQSVDAYFSFKSAPYGCPTEAVALGLTPTSTDVVEFGVTSRPSTWSPNRTTSIAMTISVKGYWDIPGYQAVAGVVSVTMPSDSNCRSYLLTWRAGSLAGSTPSPGVRIEKTPGDVFLLNSNANVGTVTIATNEGGMGIATLQISAKVGPDCSYEADISRLMRYTAGTTLESWNNGALDLAIAASNTDLRGGAVIAGSGSCPTQAFYFATPQAVKPDTARPTPAATTDAQGTGTNPTPSVTAPSPAVSLPGMFQQVPTFDASYEARAIFTGGSVNDLEAAALAQYARTVCINVPGNFFFEQLCMPVGTGTVYSPERDEFVRRFPLGISPGTDVLLRR